MLIIAQFSAMNFYFSIKYFIDLFLNIFWILQINIAKSMENILHRMET